MNGLVERLAAQLKCLVVNGGEQPSPRRSRQRNRLLGRAVIADPRVVCANGHDGGFVRPIAAIRFEQRRKGRVAAKQESTSFAFKNVPVVTAMHVPSQTCTP